MSGITSCYCAPDGGVTFDLPVEQMPATLRGDGGLLWVDIEIEARDDSELVLRDVFHFHQLTIDDCYNTLIDPPKVDDYDSYLFMIIHNVHYEAESQELRTSELNLYLGGNFVVSVHRAPVRAVTEVRRRAEARSLVLDHGPAFLAHALIDVVVDDFHPVVEAVDEQVAELEERVLAEPKRETLEELLRLKRNAQRLKRSILPQRDVVNRFSRGEYAKLIQPAALMYFRDVYDHTVRVEEMIESVRDLADSALNTYLSSVNNRTNEVMKTLAIVTVVFLPLTLIAGIYGTNFGNVPEYGWHAGYLMMLGLMAGVALGLVAWFRYRRWF